MASKEETDKKSLIIMEMANRELRQDLMMALILISNKKETFNNLDKYHAKKRLLLELFEYDQTKTDKETMASIF